MWRSRMRRLRPCLASTGSGGLGTPPYGHYDPCAGSQLDGRSKVRPGSQASARGQCEGFGPAPKRRGGALRGERPAIRARRRKAWNTVSASRRSAPSLSEGEGNEGAPRARQTTGAAQRWLSLAV
jgi:hypothetical protein